MQWLYIVILITWIIVVLWAMFDAFDHTDYGCMWLLLFVLIGPPAIIVYLFMRFYAGRSASRHVLEQRGHGSGDTQYSRFPTEIEKAHFIEAAGKGPGTMYNPETAAHHRPGGYAHFTDRHAEALLKQHRYEDAWDYLIDMYTLSRDEHDGRAQDTYQHYILRIPLGQRMLAQWHSELQEASPESKPRPPHRRDVPF